VALLLTLARNWKSIVAAGTLVVLAAAAARAQVDPRPSIVEVDWHTPAGYDRCAAVITARRPGGLEAWTAGHCATHPFTIVRFFDGHEIYGSTVRVLAISDAIDAAELLLPVDAARERNTPLAVRARTAPPLGTTLTVIGHPVSALRGPNLGRWTMTYARMGETSADPETGAVQYDIYCSRCGPGDSGSGVFDPDGHFIGIVYGVTEIANVAGGRLPDGLYAQVVPVAALR
jgi:Trypsin-like peptidase domain